MQVREEPIRHRGEDVGSLYIVEKLDRSDLSLDETFLRFVDSRRDLSFINRFTRERFKSAVLSQRQVQGQRSF